MNIGRLFRTSWRDIRASRRQDAAYREIWNAFGYYQAIADGRHDSEAWLSSSGPFAMCIIRVQPRYIQPSLNEVRSGLEPYPYVRLHPDHFLHITLQELGFITATPSCAEEITPGRLDEFIAGATFALSGAIPFDIRLGGVNSFQDAAFLDVHDRGQCSRIHTRLRELAAIPTQPKYAYVPHCTVAHYLEERPAPGLQEKLAKWRDRRFGSFTVHELEVVTMELGEPYPEFKTIFTLSLAG